MKHAIAALLPLFLLSAGLAADCSKYVQTDCNRFIENAENYSTQALTAVDNKTSYTFFIGAATEYDEAGKCLDCKKQASAASYSKALTGYLKAVSFLTPGGDHDLRGETYEKAGDVLAALKNTTGAAYYYGLAETEYLKEESPDAAKLSALGAKKAGLSAPPTQDEKPRQPSALDPLLVLLPLAVLAAVAVLFALKKGKPAFARPLRPPPPQPPAERPKERHVIPEKREAVPPREEKRAVEAAKTKLREKIRQRYGL